MYPTASDAPTYSTTRCKSNRSTSPFRGSGPIKKRKIVIKQRPSVRFNEEIEAYKPRVFKTPVLPSSTWLKEQDLSKIRDGIFSTLDAMKRKRDSGLHWNDSNNGKHFSRGLEDYSIDQKGSLKASTIHRRQNAVRAVLHEQELQLQRHNRRQSRIGKHQQKPTPRHHPILDHVKLSQVYQDRTGSNIHEAIHMGRVDSEQALAIYSELPSQKQPGHRRRLSLPVFDTPVTAKRKVKRVETTWGFTAATAPPVTKPKQFLRRIVSVS